MELKITLFNDGMLLGFTHYSKEDKLEHFRDEWNELNIYLLIFQIQFKWYG